MNNTEAVIDSLLAERIERLVRWASILDISPAELSKELGLEIPEQVPDLEMHAPALPDSGHELDILKQQVKALLEVKELLYQQHAENTANFLDIKQRDDHSSRQSVWLTVITSAISIIIGWLLSLLGTPSAVLHALGR